MIDLHALQSDRLILSQLLQERRAVTTVTLPVGVQLVWTIYLTILEDAVATLTALINHLAAKA